jgi:hypothetical protein
MTIESASLSRMKLACLAYPAYLAYLAYLANLAYLACLALPRINLSLQRN